MGQPVAYVGGTIQGTTSGEHNGHDPAHGSCALTGSITEGSSKLRVSGAFVSIAGNKTSEADCCDSGRTGALGGTAHKLRVGGVSVQAVGDATAPHNGSATITGGNAKIQIV